MRPPTRAHTGSGITHGNHPRSARLARIFQCLAVSPQPLKLVETLESWSSEKVASAVQLRPWPAHFKALAGSYVPKRSHLLRMDV